MALSRERMGEIALLIIQSQIKKEGIELRPGFRQETIDGAKELEVTPQELFEFTRELYQEYFNALLGTVQQELDTV